MSGMQQSATKEKIIEASYHLMMEKGYNHTGLKEILAIAGVPKGSFYHFFQNKEKLGLEVIEYYAKNMSFLLTQSFNKDLEPIQQLKNFFTASIKILVKDNNCCGGCLVGNIGQELADQKPVFRKKAEQILSQWQNQITLCIKQGQEENSINSEIKAEQLASFLFNSWEGAIMRMKISKSDVPLKDFMNTIFNSKLLSN